MPKPPFPEQLKPEWLLPAKTFLLPNWDVIAAEVEVGLDADSLQELYVQLGRLWINGLRQQFGTEYQLVESENFFLVSQAETQRTKEALRFLEHSLRRIHSGLPFVPKNLGYGKWPVLCLEGDLFYQYLLDFFSDEEETVAHVGGVYLNRGYGHFAVPDAELARYSSVFVHELTHAVLQSCNLPAWLDEAVAMTVENHITREQPYELTREWIRRHQAYWTEENIQRFWTGRSFWSPDEGQELSYHLARFLFTALYQGGTTEPRLISEFISQAKREDAGFESALRCLDIDLGEVLHHLLGEGRWQPDVEAINALFNEVNSCATDTNARFC